MTILYAFLWFAGISLVLGAMLAIASIVFEVKVDPRSPRSQKLFPVPIAAAAALPAALPAQKQLLRVKRRLLRVLSADSLQRIRSPRSWA